MFEVLPTDPTFCVMDFFDHTSFIHFGRASKCMKEIVLNPKFWRSPVIIGGGLLTIQQLPKNLTDAKSDHSSHQFVMDVGQRLARSLLRYCRTKVEWCRVPIHSWLIPPDQYRPGVGYTAALLSLDSPIHQLQEPYVSADELVSLAYVPNLRILDAYGYINEYDRIGRSKIKPPKWNWLLERSNLLKHLEILRLGAPSEEYGCQIDQRSMELISQLPSLHTFTLDCSVPTSPVGLFAPLHRSKSLRTLQYSTDFFDANRCHLTDVRKCTNLTTLSLCSMELFSQEFVDFFTHPNIANSLEYLGLKVFERYRGSVKQLDPTLILPSTFASLISLRCLWLSIEEQTGQRGSINQLLPHLIHLPHLSQLIITINIFEAVADADADDAGPGTVQYPGLNRLESDVYLPSVTNLQLLSFHPTIERICLENIDDTGKCDSDPVLIRPLEKFSRSIANIPKVEWNEKKQIKWRLPKQLEQTRRD